MILAGLLFVDVLVLTLWAVISPFRMSVMELPQIVSAFCVSSSVNELSTLKYFLLVVSGCGGSVFQIISGVKA